MPFRMSSVVRLPTLKYPHKLKHTHTRRFATWTKFTKDASALFVIYKADIQTHCQEHPSNSNKPHLMPQAEDFRESPTPTSSNKRVTLREEKRKRAIVRDQRHETIGDSKSHCTAPDWFRTRTANAHFLCCPKNVSYKSYRQIQLAPVQNHHCDGFSAQQ